MSVTPPTAPYTYTPHRTQATDQQLAQAAYNAGFRGDALVKAVAIALAESHGNVTAVNDNERTNPVTGKKHGEFSVGVWQINLNGDLVVRLRRYGLTKWTDLWNLQNNANAAYRISGRGTHFGAWSTYNHGTYLKYMSRANAAATSVTGQKPVVVDAGDTSSNPDAAIAASVLDFLMHGLVDNVYGPTPTWQEVINQLRLANPDRIGPLSNKNRADYLQKVLTEKHIDLNSSSYDGWDLVVQTLSDTAGVPNPIKKTDITDPLTSFLGGFIDPIAHGFYFLIFIIIAIALLIVGAMAGKVKT